MTSIADLVFSNTAVKKGVDNNPTSAHLVNLAWLTARCDEAKRVLAGYSPVLTSGYRSKALSVAVGGNEHDEHTTGLAFDLACGLGDAQGHLVAAKIVFNNRQLIGGAIHQVIAEPGHVHVGFYPQGKVGPCELRVKDGAHYPLVSIAT